MDKSLSLVSCLRSHQNDVNAYYAAIYAQAGESGIFWDEVLHGWVVTSFQECAALLSDPRLMRARLVLPPCPEMPDMVAFAQRVLDAQMMFSDDPEAVKRRRYWSRIFVENADASPEQSLRQIAHATMDACKVSLDIDAYADLLQPFVSRVMCMRMGLDEEERAQLYPHINRYARFLDGKLGRREELEAALLSIGLLYSRLASKQDVLAPAWAEEEQEAIDRHQWASDYVLSLVAGHESTAYLLATVLLHGGRQGEVLSIAGTDRRRLSRLVMEALRYDGPVQLIGRRVGETFMMRGCTLRAGQRVFLHIGAANRDPSVYASPEVFDPDRAGPAPLSFGWGQNQCIGRSLALSSAVIFLMVLAERGQRIEVDGTRAEWSSGLAGRGFCRVPGRLLGESRDMRNERHT